jgi:hypothetical protein
MQRCELVSRAFITMGRFALIDVFQSSLKIALLWPAIGHRLPSWRP